MNAPVVLCSDSFSLQYPHVLGLPDENLADQKWLRVFSDGEEAREYVASQPDTPEVWVLGSDDVEAINLAASIKADCADGFADCRVFLVTGEGGDVPMRARAANLDGVLEPARFAGRYAQRKAASTCDSSQVSGTVMRRFGVEEVAGQAFLLPVVSAGGGSGKSTVAVLAALAAARLGRKVLLLDADFQFGDAADMVTGLARRSAVWAPHTFDEVLDGTLRVETLVEAAVPVGSRGGSLSLLGACRAPERAEACGEALAELLPQLLDSFDVVVANTSAWWSEVQAALIDRASRVLYVLDQRPSAMRLARRVLALCSTCGIATGSFTTVLNRCKRGALYTAVDVGCVLDGCTVREVQDGGAEVEECMALGHADDLFAAYNPAARSIAELIGELLPGGSRRTGERGELGDADVSGGSGDSRVGAGFAKARSRGGGWRRWSVFGGRGGESCPF